MLWPKAEEIIRARIVRGRGAVYRSREKRKYWDMAVWLPPGDYAKFADIEGVDFDAINKDLCDYYHDCED